MANLFKKHDCRSKVGFCFHLSQNKMAAFEKHSRETRNIFKKDIRLEFNCGFNMYEYSCLLHL